MRNQWACVSSSRETDVCREAQMRETGPWAEVGFRALLCLPQEGLVQRTLRPWLRV